jgi:hypothetical protein
VLVEAHPLVSSVLYLTDEGGPTAVFDQTLESAGSTHAGEEAVASVPVPAAAAQVAVCAPARNRLLLFDGRLLHAVLHRPGGRAAGLRRTLLINWWAKQPPGVEQIPRWLLQRCASLSPIRSSGAGGSDDARDASGVGVASRFELVQLAREPTQLDGRGVAAARFLSDVRAHWAQQRAPAEVERAYGAAVSVGRSPVLLACYHPDAGSERSGAGVAAVPAEPKGPSTRAAEAQPPSIVRACRTVPRDGATETWLDVALRSGELSAVERELRAIWPPR